MFNFQVFLLVICTENITNQAGTMLQRFISIRSLPKYLNSLKLSTVSFVKAFCILLHQMSWLLPFLCFIASHYGTHSNKVNAQWPLHGYGYGRTMATGTGVLRAYISELQLRTYASCSKQYYGCDCYYCYGLAMSAGAAQCLILVPWQLFQSL